MSQDHTHRSMATHERIRNARAHHKFPEQRRAEAQERAQQRANGDGGAREASRQVALTEK